MEKRKQRRGDNLSTLKGAATDPKLGMLTEEEAKKAYLMKGPGPHEVPQYIPADLMEKRKKQGWEVLEEPVKRGPGRPPKDKTAEAEKE